MASGHIENHERVQFAARTGDLADFHSDAQGDAVHASRVVDGAWLSDFITNPASEIHHAGIRIAGALIIGDLNLEATTSNHRLLIRDCEFDNGRVLLDDATVRSLALSGTTCSGVFASSAQVIGDIHLSNGFISNGPVDLFGAKINGSVICANAQIHCISGPAFHADQARINGDLSLSDGFEAQGEVRLVGATVGGGLLCHSGHFRNAGDAALNASQARIDGSIFLNNGFTAIGEVNFYSTSIGGFLLADGGQISNPDGLALIAASAQIAGDVYLADGFVSKGQVEFFGAKVGGSVNCRSGSFRSDSRPAFQADQARINGDLAFADSFEAYGEVRLVGATIGGGLLCDGGQFENVGNVALNASQARIDGSIFLAEGFTANGEVNLDSTSIGGFLLASGGQVSNPNGNAVDADNAKFGSNVSLNHGFHAKGQVSLRHTTISGDLDLSNGHFENPGEVSANLESSNVSGAINIGGDFQADGMVNLQNATTLILDDAGANPPDLINLVGFKYASLQGSMSFETRKRWLQSQVQYAAQPFLQLAHVLRTSGHDRNARKILIERHNALLAPPDHWKIPPRRRSFLWKQFLRFTVGHGYEPWRALFPAIAILLAMTAWYHVAAKDDLLIPTSQDPNRSVVASSCTTHHTCVQPFILALDTLVPLVDLRQGESWIPDQSAHSTNPIKDGRWLAWAGWLTTIVGWVLASLIAVSLTNVVKQE